MSQQTQHTQKNRCHESFADWKARRWPDDLLITTKEYRDAAIAIQRIYRGRHQRSNLKFHLLCGQGCASRGCFCGCNWPLKLIETSLQRVVSHLRYTESYPLCKEGDVTCPKCGEPNDPDEDEYVLCTADCKHCHLIKEDSEAVAIVRGIKKIIVIGQDGPYVWRDFVEDRPCCKDHGKLHRCPAFQPII